MAKDVDSTVAGSLQRCKASSDRIDQGSARSTFSPTFNT
jgi:hypothetical protein